MTTPVAMHDRPLRVHVEQTFQTASGLHNEGKLDEADRLYQFILAEMPTHYDSLFRLGLLRARADQLDDAVHLFGRAVAAKPDSADALGWLGIALAALDRHDEALAYCQKALSINPEQPVVHCALGTELCECGRIEQAIIHFERAIAIAPDFAHAHNKLGTAFLYLGRIEDARQTYENALALAPRDAQVHHNLAYLRRFMAGDPRLAALEKLAEDMASLDTENQISLHFALGKAFCDLGQYERSFRELREGNALKRAQIAYDEKEILRLFERIRVVFTPELMQQKSGGGCHSDAPVFVVGMPRSGTTLVEQILASHSKVYGAGEIETFGQAIMKFRSRNDIATEFPDMVPAMSPEALRDIGSDYVGLVKPTAGAAERIVNKLPLNFRYVGLIHLTLPHARIIHVRRDPVDTCFSCFSILFAGDLSFTYDLGEVGRYYRSYATLMEHWRSVLPRGVMIDVRYEDLVADIEGQARAIVDHCGLVWEDACLAFHTTQRQVMTASAAQVRKPLYRTSVGRGRQYESFLQPLIEALKAPDSAAVQAGV